MGGGIGRLWKTGGTVVLVILLLASCTGKSQEKRGGAGYVALDLDPVVPATVPPPSLPATDTADPAPVSGTPSLTVVSPGRGDATHAEVLRDVQPNGLGRIPVLMYHAFTSDPDLLDEWTRLSSDFRDDLQWLYDHDFHLISMRDLLEHQIDIPAGKHPVVLTFDDSSAGQFLFVEDAHGDLVPGPTSAVGVMEAFFAEHPDFGHTAHFAIVPNDCFAYNHEFNTKDYCGQKLTWLADHGYEIGNHTWWHANLKKVSYDTVVEQIGSTAEFIDEHVSGDANMSRTLTLPFGARPDPGTAKASLLSDGFVYDGEDIVLDAIIDVAGGPMYSPFSTEWDAYAISRLNTDQDSLDYWFSAIDNGDIVLFTSDGDPDTVSIPDPLLTSDDGEPDLDRIVNAGKQMITYDPTSGQISRRSGTLADTATMARAGLRFTHRADDPWYVRSVSAGSTQIVC